MKKLAHFITKNSLVIVIVSFLLLIPSFIGMEKTKINYDLLTYLPDDIDTVKGQNVLIDEFGIGAFSFVIVDNMSAYDLLKMEDNIKKIKEVNQVMSIADITDTVIPLDMLPNDILNKIYDNDKTVIAITFKTSTSDEKTINAIDSLRNVVNDNCKISGMTAMVLDTMNLSNQEIVAYIVIAVILCIVVLICATDSYLVPIFLLGNIGLAIMYNMGSNIILGNISYITKAISAVLQLGVTTDFSIFLYHKYEDAKVKNKNKKEAMEMAINETFKSVIGSSLTTIAGFLALCTMNLTLGMDIGLVMAKGVLFGLISVLTIFPSLLLTFDSIIEKTKHKILLPKFEKIQKFSIKHYRIIFIVFIFLWIPAIIGNNNVSVYYKLDKSLPSDLPSSIANQELKEKFNIVSPEIILVDKDIINEMENLVDELKNIDGIDLVLAPNSLLSSGLPPFMFSSDLEKVIDNDSNQLIVVNSIYEIASDELNEQIKKINTLVKKYDKEAIVAGEGPLMKDLTEIADHDFKMVNYSSIIVIFILMLIVLKSISLPFILVITIEFAIFLNMAISYYTGSTLPFIASIVIGTIQLGATIDYAILMSTRYLDERKINDKFTAIKNTLKGTVPSIITSALCFFAATFGVYLYSKIDMIGSICNLLSRGSIISMLVVILILPALLIIFDRLITKTTKGMKEVIYEKNK